MRTAISTKRTRSFWFCLAIVAVMSVCVTSVLSAPPHPSLLEKKAAGLTDGACEAITFPDMDELHARGIGAPDDFFVDFLSSPRRTDTEGASAGFNVLALLVDFSDHPAQVPASFYDSLIFDSGPGSIRDYISEISYGQVELQTANMPSTIGWTRAPQPYSYYVNANYGMGSFPNNSQGLVSDLVAAVDGTVDFTPYDNDGDTYVDVLIVVHTGTGAEVSASINDMWSHKWGVVPLSVDGGVKVSSFTVQPEFWHTAGDMTIGVYSHELCHGFGLPDLYDIDNSSNGIGKWGLMSFGSWNGPTGYGESPSHPSAWCRIQMGMATPVDVTGTLTDQAIGAVETVGSIYKLPMAVGSASEYFLVENRQRIGYDTYLPGDGLLIWHIDEAKSTNEQEWWPGQTNSAHYLAALEQADASYHLEHADNAGTAADPFPGTTNNTSFVSSSAPSSDSYVNGNSSVEVTSISASASTMYATLQSGVPADVRLGETDQSTLPSGFALSQNYPNPFNPVTNIELTVPTTAHVTVVVYNLLGQEVETLLDGEVTTGKITLTWDSSTPDNHELASGVYFYTLSVDGCEESHKMLLLK